MNLIEIVAQTLPSTGPSAAPLEPPPGWFVQLRSFFPLLLIGVVFYFLVFGSKRKQEKQRQTMLSQLKKGDEVVTIGGQIGKVLDARPDRVQLKVDETSNTKIWFLRSAIHRVMDEESSESK